VEWLIGLGVAGLAVWLVAKWFAFSSFKSELMNAFGQEGIDYETADTFYAVHAKTINSLYGQGMAAAKIVQLIIDSQSVPADRVSQDNHAHSVDPETSQAGGGDALESEHELQQVIAFVVGLLTTQSMLMRQVDGEIPKNAVDDWVLGYIHGHYDAALQAKGVPLDSEAKLGFSTVLEQLFEPRRGLELAEQHVALSMMQPAEFIEGAQAGGDDLFRFLKNTNDYPMSWSHRYFRLCDEAEAEPL
jgi:hypothetical protein